MPQKRFGSGWTKTFVKMFRRVGPRARQTQMKQMAPIQKLERHIDYLSKSALCLNGPLRTGHWWVAALFNYVTDTLLHVLICDWFSTSQRSKTPACVTAVREAAKNLWLLHEQLIHMLLCGEFCILRTGTAPNDWLTSWQSSCLARLADRWRALRKSMDWNWQNLKSGKRVKTQTVTVTNRVQYANCNSVQALICLNTKIHVLACQPGVQLTCDSLFSEMSVSNFTQKRVAGKTEGMVLCKCRASLECGILRYMVLFVSSLDVKTSNSDHLNSLLTTTTTTTTATRINKNFNTNNTNTDTDYSTLKWGFCLLNLVVIVDVVCVVSWWCGFLSWLYPCCVPLMVDPSIVNLTLSSNIISSHSVIQWPSLDCLDSCLNSVHERAQATTPASWHDSYITSKTLSQISSVLDLTTCSPVWLRQYFTTDHLKGSLPKQLKMATPWMLPELWMDWAGPKPTLKNGISAVSP